jgi:hypothetical protein
MRWNPGSSPPSTFPIAVDGATAAVVVTMTAVAGELSDGIRMEIPVVRYQTPETVGTSGVVAGNERGRGDLRARERDRRR